MKLPNKVAIGLNAWLTFEEMCGRATLFSEAYLSFPLGQLLSAEYGSSLIAEYPHPVLARRKQGPGDKPRLDFAVLRQDSRVEVAIETKWLSKSTTLHRDLVRDLVRLELTAHAQGAETWLIVAGWHEDFNALVNDKKFQGHPDHIGSDPVLPHGNSQSGRLRLNPPARFRKKWLTDALRPFRGVELTDCVHVTRFGPHPAEPTHNKYVTYLWRIDPRRQVSRFLPETVYEWDGAI